MNFFKKLFGKAKAEESQNSGNYIVATINDKIMPIDRGDIYEDPLDDFLQENGIGEVCGGGTMQLESGEIEYCDIEISLNNDTLIKSQIKLIIEKLESLGAPKGSKLLIEKTGEEIEFGIKEGLGIYLDGVNLDEEVYNNSDSNIVVSEIKRLTNDTSEALRFWEGQNETGLYFYSDSFENMKKSIQSFINEYPLCKGARVEKIA
jgi:hypothetical protein